MMTSYSKNVFSCFRVWILGTAHHYVLWNHGPFLLFMFLFIQILFLLINTGLITPITAAYACFINAPQWLFIVFVILLLLLLFFTIPLSSGCCDEEISTFAGQIQEILILILINRNPDHFLFHCFGPPAFISHRTHLQQQVHMFLGARTEGKYLTCIHLVPKNSQKQIVCVPWLCVTHIQFNLITFIWKQNTPRFMHSSIIKVKKLRIL